MDYAFIATPSTDGGKTVITIDLAARAEDFSFFELKSDQSSKVVLEVESVGINGESEFCILMQYGYCYLYRASKKDEKVQLALYPLPLLKDGTYNVKKSNLEPGGS